MKSIPVETIQETIKKLKAEREDMRRQAEQMIAGYNGRISALEDLLKTPKELAAEAAARGPAPAG